MGASCISSRQRAEGGGRLGVALAPETPPPPAPRRSPPPGRAFTELSSTSSVELSSSPESSCASSWCPVEASSVERL